MRLFLKYKQVCKTAVKQVTQGMNPPHGEKITDVISLSVRH
jgi:hypothetical protein